ncbi:MAG TPA: helix-turn-helix domain-containing protein [Nitrospirae bacterium]|nr:helix-turn-helix protein [bacterium BMS3Bbin09]HDO25037.1 helix-turn-helix domain-containing protein [Nitrospirota bacterium]
MISKRLKQLRLARGLSLDALVAQMGGLVTKQALSKYELGKAKPSPVVLNKIASVLGVKSAYFWSEPDINVQFIAYRKGSGLVKKEQARVEALVTNALEDRIKLQEITQQRNGSSIPIQKLRLRKLKDSEDAAESLRSTWDLGLDPIADITAVLEDHLVYVIEVKAGEKFDGISAVAYDNEKNIKAASVVSRLGVPGERQRLNLAHELGHLVLKTPSNVDEEKAAFRFGAAFLAPADGIYREVGNKRGFIQTEELLMLKRRFGISIQALLYRLHDLEVITDSYYKKWCMDINRLKWKKTEPLELDPEQPQWLRRNVLRALAEELITKEEAEKMLGESIEDGETLSYIERRSFMKLPLEERRRIMAEQAEKMVTYYGLDSDIKEFQGGDIIEY